MGYKSSAVINSSTCKPKGQVIDYETSPVCHSIELRQPGSIYDFKCR